MSIWKTIGTLLPPEKVLSPQLVHYRGTGEHEGERMHLRIEPGGTGILVINASKVIHLNTTAAELAKHVLEGNNEREAVRALRKRYRVDKGTALRDFVDVRTKIRTLVESDDVCPVSYLGFSRVAPFSVKTTAPQRMDLALTYACDNACGHCYVARSKETPPMDQDQWKQVLARLWEIGIPHVCFTGGEATLSADLPALIEYAEEVGQVTGLLTNGRKLAQGDYTGRLVEMGLDHVQITLESHDEAIHDAMVCAPGAWKETVAGIRNAADQRIYLVTNSTLSKRNAPTFVDTLSFLHDLGVKNIACNGFIHSGDAVANPDGLEETELPALLERIRDRASLLEMRLIWYTPTQYCNCNPIELELGMRRCTAGTSNMCIEPDGSVLPCQSYFSSLGNILIDSWAAMWNHPTLTGIRERKWIDPKCDGCEELELCGGGCPLYLKNGSFLCSDTMSNPV